MPIKNVSTRRRLVVAMLIIGALVLVLVGRLFDYQVVQAEALSKQAYERRSIPQIVYGKRGEIYDTNGVVLADSVVRYNITAAPNIMKDIRKVVDGKVVTETVQQAIADLAATTGVDAATITANLTKDPASNHAYVAQSVTADIYNAVRALSIPWVFYEQQPARTYPLGAVAGNLVGFMGKDGPGAGTELYQNDCLKSSDGTQTYERGEDGVQLPGSTVTTKVAHDGGDVTLTVDSDLQWFSQQTLNEAAAAQQAEWGIAVVIEIKTGKLRAVAEWPSVDPNDPGASSSDTWTSRSFTSPYEPGSIMKPFTASMLIDAGKITPTTQVTVPYRYTPREGANINDSGYHPELRLTTTGILVQSSNVGISKLTELMSPKDRYDYLKAYGLGQKTAVGFQGESSGDLKPYQEWDNQTNYAVMFGQGVNTTAVQMAGAYQALGNGGVKLPVSLVEKCTAADGTVTEVPSTEGTRVVSAAAARTTVDMMETVANEGWLKAMVAIPGYRVATKTGTAQVAENGAYGSKYTYSLIGMAPAEDPQYAVLVSLRNPLVTRSTASDAPIFRKIMEQTLKTYRVEPSTTPSPTFPTTW